MLRMDSVVKISNSQTWQQELSGAFTQLDKLLAYLNLDINDLEEHELSLIHISEPTRPY